MLTRNYGMSIVEESFHAAIRILDANGKVSSIIARARRTAVGVNFFNDSSRAVRSIMCGIVSICARCGIAEAIVGIVKGSAERVLFRYFAILVVIGTVCGDLNADIADLFERSGPVGVIEGAPDCFFS